mmetsp:Transcript_17792/g.21792  ORF Transcript_17792/g.21792 Transcript_17792/m.21792 type:complete len:94 (+) Transcript_17792:115-396(+)
MNKLMKFLDVLNHVTFFIIIVVVQPPLRSQSLEIPILGIYNYGKSDVALIDLSYAQYSTRVIFRNIPKKSSLGSQSSRFIDAAQAAFELVFDL